MDLKSFDSPIKSLSGGAMAGEERGIQMVEGPTRQTFDSQEAILERDNSSTLHDSIATNDTITLQREDSEELQKWTFPWALTRTWKVRI
jgi:hypothetical protein